MKNRTGLLLAASCLFAASAAAQTLDVVHRFQRDGGAYGRLIQAADGNFYGTTSWGGTNGIGTIFRMDSSGAVATLHSFGYTEGAYPKAALLQGADGNFYGTASEGGTSNVGTIFKMDSAGSVTILFNFSGPDGANPWAPLIQTANGSLYGTTRGGGAAGHGTIFTMDSTGNLTTLHGFAGGTDGDSPYAALLKAADGNFYGTTAGIPNYYGCSTPCGTVFKMDGAGNVTTLHYFSNPSGASPRAALVQDADGNLYGTTPSRQYYVNRGGFWVFVHGNIFKIDSSAAFSVLYTFTSTGGTGSPGGLLLASDGNLYGTAIGFGSSIFRVVSSGAFETLYSFTGPEGASPYGGLVQASDGNYYGAAVDGGAGGAGTLFKMDSSSSVTALYSFPSEGSEPHASLIQAPDGTFYGTTGSGGAAGGGTVFKTDSSGAITTLHSFVGSDGAYPSASLLRGADGNFYGTTTGGGALGDGTVFKMDPSGNVTMLHDFTGGDGISPLAALIQLADGSLYGTTTSGGASGWGTVFKIDPSGTLTTLHSFDNTDGAQPYAGLIRSADGSLLGTTYGDGATTWGSIFKITTTGMFTPLHSFNQADGASSTAALIHAADGNYYGTTRLGGANGHGTVFKMDSTGSVTTLHSFDGSDGDLPSSELVQTSDGNLFGTTADGGAGNNGTIFELDSSGNFTNLLDFNYAAAADTFAGLVLAADGSLWGNAWGGGLGGFGGTVFRLILGSASLEVTSISPASGDSSGRTPVSIVGAGFQASARVMIGGSPGDAVSISGSTAASALTPSLMPGTLNDVTIINVDASFGTGIKLWFADFLDVPQGDAFHDDVETIFRKRITAGQPNGEYGRDNPATRAQMAVFLLKAEHGSSYMPPTCTGTFPDVPCPSLFADWIEQLAAEGVTAGCGGGLYCPDSSVTRRQMAVFLLKASEGSGHTPPPATGIFGDVPQGDTYAPWIEELYNRGITGGCQASPLLYCPENPSTRGQMAVFLVKTFGL